MNIRNAKSDDLDRIVYIEQVCFPREEAATRNSLQERIETYPAHFYLLEEDGKTVAFINGMVTEREHLEDEMYENVHLHNEDGAWQMIFGVDTLPQYRKRGFAGLLIRHMTEKARSQGRKGVVLTCKEPLVSFYEKFGFKDEGISDSTHGGVVWHEMRLSFEKR